MKAYIAYLKQRAAEATAKSAAQPTSANSVEEHIATWYQAQPPATRQRAYTMRELRDAFDGINANQLAPALLAQGWTRHRVVVGEGASQTHHRVWLPPGVSAKVLPQRNPVGRPKRQMQSSESEAL